MSNLERNAIKIAELIGLPTTPSNTFVFEYYDGLMPIVFEIYASQHFTINIYNWVGRCILLGHNSNATPNWGQEPLDGNYRYDFDIDITENEFIEGLQTVIIKYLELKN